VNKLFIDFMKAYDSVRREVLYNIFIQFGVPMKLVRLITVCLRETYSTVQVGKNLPDMFLNFALECTIIMIEVNKDGLKLNGTHQLLVYADDVNTLGGSINTIRENAEALTSNETGLEVNADKSKYVVMYRD